MPLTHKNIRCIFHVCIFSGSDMESRKMSKAMPSEADNNCMLHKVLLEILENHHPHMRQNKGKRHTLSFDDCIHPCDGDKYVGKTICTLAEGKTQIYSLDREERHSVRETPSKTNRKIISPGMFPVITIQMTRKFAVLRTNLCTL